MTGDDWDLDGTITVASVDLDPATAGQQTTLTTAQGTWTVDGAGNVTFTPAPGFAGTATASYTVLDNEGLVSNVAALAVGVPGFTITKSASPTAAAPYQPVTYTYTVTNTGGTDLSGIDVTDDNGTPAFAGDDFPVGTTNTLTPGQSQTFTAKVIPVVSTTGVVNGVTVPAGAVIVVVPQANGDIKVTYLQNFGINDNTYGTGAI